MSNLQRRSLKKRVQATVPEPLEDVKSLRASVMGLKELAETLAGQRGQAYDFAVTWGDLIDLGLITEQQLPYAFGPNTVQR